MEQASVVTIRSAEQEMAPTFQPSVTSSPANVFIQEVSATSHSEHRMSWQWRSPSSGLVCSPLAFGRFRKIQRWPRTDPEDERSEHELFMNRLKSLSLSGDTTENLAFPRAIQTPSRVGILASKTSPAHKLRRRVSARKVLVPEGCVLESFDDKKNADRRRARGRNSCRGHGWEPGRRLRCGDRQ